MRFKKYGKIFDPNDHILPNKCQQFAQSPQALVFDDFVRIYFSTRALDPCNGKYLSNISFVDLTKDFKTIIQVSKHPVIELGQLGCFDEHGIFPMNVVRHNNAVYAYTCGWSRRVSVSVETAIGLAVSHDNGLSFQRLGAGPILSASMEEPFLVGDGFVKIIDGTFHMWYIFGTSWKSYGPNSAPDRTYKIGHATSEDGINWVRDGKHQIIQDRLGIDESQALPSIVKIKNRYHMFFCYRESFDFRITKNRGYKIGHAWSDDLKSWIRDDESPSLQGDAGQWDSDMQCYPHIFECDNKFFLLYNGNEFGRHGFGAAELIQ